MIRVLLTYFALFVVNNLLVAQIITRSVISTNAMVSDHSFGSFSYAVGEPVVVTLEKGSFVLTQGFQQPSIKAATPSSDYINVYPNPVQDQLTIEFGVDEITSYRIGIFDITGRKIFEKKYDQVSSGNQYLDFSQMNQGFYLLHIRSEYGRLVRTLKIEKM